MCFLDVRFFFWVSLLPDFWGVCGYRLHSFRLEGGVQIEEGEKSWMQALFSLCFQSWWVREPSQVCGHFAISLPTHFPWSHPCFCFTARSRSGRLLLVMRWSMNEERDFYTCWVRGEALDPHSVGKNTELGGGFILGAAAAPSAFPVTEFPPHSKSQGSSSPLPHAIISQVMLESCVDALWSCLWHSCLFQGSPFTTHYRKKDLLSVPHECGPAKWEKACREHILEVRVASASCWRPQGAAGAVWWGHH